MAPSLTRHASLIASAVAFVALPACMVVNTPPHHQHNGADPAATATATATAADAPPPPQPAYVETPQPSEAPPEQPKGVGEGRPAGFHRGAPEGLWIWHDDGGWHVRSTTARALHRFSGRVWGGRGEVGAVHATRVELGDRFRKAGNTMTFDFHTQGDEDGFDFQIAESDCASFNVLIDGKAQPSRVFLGARAVSPPAGHFRVCK